MRYGVVINMDYGNNSYEETSMLFDDIEKALLRHGFRREGRVFTTDLPPAQTYTLARKVLDEVADKEQHRHKDLFHFIKEFYGFEIVNVVNLLLPDTSEISVTELDSTALEDIMLKGDSA